MPALRLSATLRADNCYSLGSVATEHGLRNRRSMSSPRRGLGHRRVFFLFSYWWYILQALHKPLDRASDPETRPVPSSPHFYPRRAYSNFLNVQSLKLCKSSTLTKSTPSSDRVFQIRPRTLSAHAGDPQYLAFSPRECASSTASFPAGYRSPARQRVAEVLRERHAGIVRVRGVVIGILQRIQGRVEEGVSVRGVGH